MDAAPPPPEARGRGTGEGCDPIRVRLKPIDEALQRAADYWREIGGAAPPVPPVQAPPVQVPQQTHDEQHPVPGARRRQSPGSTTV